MLIQIIRKFSPSNYKEISENLLNQFLRFPEIQSFFSNAKKISENVVI